jgi:hypothetical protein
MTRHVAHGSTELLDGTDILISIPLISHPALVRPFRTTKHEPDVRRDWQFDVSADSPPRNPAELAGSHSLSRQHRHL